MPYLHVKKSQNRILFTLCLGWHCADQPAVLSRTEADCDRSGLCQAGHRSVCLGTVALRLLSSKVLRLCQGLARGSHQGAPKHHPEPQANLLGLVRLEGNLWLFPGPKGDRNMRPLALGPELCLLYPPCISWGKSGCNVHPTNTSNGSKRAIPRLWGRELVSPWKGKEEPQSSRCSWDLEGRAWKKGTLRFCLALAAF